MAPVRTFVFAEDLLGQALSACGCQNPAICCSGQFITSCLLEQNKQTKKQTNKQKNTIFFSPVPVEFWKETARNTLLSEVLKCSSQALFIKSSGLRKTRFHIFVSSLRVLFNVFRSYSPPHNSPRSAPFPCQLTLCPLFCFLKPTFSNLCCPYILCCVSVPLGMTEHGPHP